MATKFCAGRSRATIEQPTRFDLVVPDHGKAIWHRSPAVAARVANEVIVPCFVTALVCVNVVLAISNSRETLQPMALI